MSGPDLKQSSAQPSERSVFLPHGRIGRVSYAIRWAVTFASFAAVGMFQKQTTPESDLHLLATCLAYALFAFLVITSIKRIHDIGYGALAVIILGPIVPLLLFVPGEKGSNAYGLPPQSTKPSQPQQT